MAIMVHGDLRLVMEFEVCDGWHDPTAWLRLEELVSEDPSARIKFCGSGTVLLSGRLERGPGSRTGG